MLHTQFIQNQRNYWIMKQTQKRVTKRHWTFIAISTLFIIVGFILNMVLRKQLFLMNLNFIISYQESGNAFTTVVYNIFTILCGVQVSGAILALLLLLSHRKAMALTIIFYFTSIVYVMSILKIAVADPRPAWFSPYVKYLQWQCQYTFGFPSGHCLVIFLLYELIITNMIGVGPYYVFLLLPILFAVFVPLSRQYLGAHSADQVLDSLVFSIGLAVLFYYLLKNVILRLFSKMLIVKHSCKIFAFIVFLQLISLVPSIVIYQVNKKVDRMGDYNLNQLNSICGSNYTEDQVERKQASQTFLISIPFGILYGLLLFRRRFFLNSQGRLRVAHYLTGHWRYKHNRCVRFIIKMLLYIIPTGIIIAVFVVIFPKYVLNFYADYFCMTLGTTLAMLYMVRYVPQLAFKCHLIQQDYDEPRNPYYVGQTHNKLDGNNFNSGSQI